MKKSSCIIFSSFVLFILGFALFAMGAATSLKNGALIIAGAIFICTAFLIVNIAVIFLSGNE